MSTITIDTQQLVEELRTAGIPQEQADGLDDCRGHVAGTQEFLLNHSLISIFSAWADAPWVNNGAAVRVSMVRFGVELQPAALPANTNASFDGTKKMR